MKGFKTIAFNVIMLIIMGVRVINPEAELPDEATVEATVLSLDAGLTALWGIGNIILRGVTDSPIFKKV
ncbi:hypothetical protein LCGC14_2801100 [marine sediment metagenome]|uniref:Uncharacterized protein n=1 Tax=marine sediment metagenome TaxID=412755 RepID=A0A0F9AW39_9ZZZZ